MYIKSQTGMDDILNGFYNYFFIYRNQNSKQEAQDAHLNGMFP